VFIEPTPPDIISDTSSDSSDEEEDRMPIIEETEESEPEIKPKTKKVDGRKRPRSEAEKKRLREQLARGREKSRATRDKNNQLKRWKVYLKK